MNLTTTSTAMGGVLTEAEKETNYNYNTYGVLYNFEAAKDACPPGTHLPTDEEWYRLESFLTGEGKTCNKSRDGSYDCDPAGTALKGWGTVTGTNSSGFTALPSGIRDERTREFDYITAYAGFWSSSESGTSTWRRYLYSSNTQVYRGLNNKARGSAVRCVQ